MCGYAFARASAAHGQEIPRFCQIAVAMHCATIRTNIQCGDYIIVYGNETSVPNAHLEYGAEMRGHAATTA